MGERPLQMTTHQCPNDRCEVTKAMYPDVHDGLIREGVNTAMKEAENVITEELMKIEKPRSVWHEINVFAQKIIKEIGVGKMTAIETKEKVWTTQQIHEKIIDVQKEGNWVESAFRQLEWVPRYAASDFDSAFKEAYAKYELRRKQKYGDSWKSMTLIELRNRLNDEISEWRNADTLTEEKDELLDIINFALMLVTHIQRVESERA